MARRSRQHTSDEFGRTGLGSAAAIGDRALGSASGVLVDGLAEAESGVTPGPGPSGRSVLIGFGALLLLAAVIITVATVLSAPETLAAGSHRGVWVGTASLHPSETDLELQLMPDATGEEEVPVWAARADERTAIVIDGRPVGTAELIDYLGNGMVRSDVTSTDEGVISRIEIVTPGVTHE
ncbi:MAG: hypothetical protein WBI63_09935 [Coriobacteriia bacterium]